MLKSGFKKKMKIYAIYFILTATYRTRNICTNIVNYEQTNINSYTKYISKQSYISFHVNQTYYNLLVIIYLEHNIE